MFHLRRVLPLNLSEQEYLTAEKIAKIIINRHLNDSLLLHQGSKYSNPNHATNIMVFRGSHHLSDQRCSYSNTRNKYKE